MGFILRMLHLGRKDSGAIMLCKFLVAAVQYSLIPGIVLHTSFKIARDQKTHHSSKIVVGMNISLEPILNLHVIAEFCIGKTTAWQNSDKQVALETPPVTGS